MSSDDPLVPPASAPPPRPPISSKPLPREKPPGRPIFPVVLSVLFVTVLVAAWVAEGSRKPDGPTGGAAAPAPAPAPGAVAGEAGPSQTAPVASSDELKGLRDEVAALSKKVDTLPHPEPAPDLKSIHDKVDGLAKAVEPAAELPGKVDDVSGKLAASAKEVEALKGEVDTLKGEIASLKDAIKSRPEPAPDSARPGPADDRDGKAMASAVDLFRAGKYAEARDAFKKLPADDARVLYYTALANGFATNAWKGETEETVLKGVASEKAGHPAKAEIDAAFAGLKDTQGKAWLGAYRQRAR